MVNGSIGGSIGGRFNNIEMGLGQLVPLGELANYCTYFAYIRVRVRIPGSPTPITYHHHVLSHPGILDPYTMQSHSNSSTLQIHTYDTNINQLRRAVHGMNRAYA